MELVLDGIAYQQMGMNEASVKPLTHERSIAWFCEGGSPIHPRSSVISHGFRLFVSEFEGRSGSTKWAIHPTFSRVFIPHSVISLGSSYFSNCKSLRAIGFEMNCKLKQIGDFCFSNCGLDSVFIPNEVSIFGMNCFRRCSLDTMFFDVNSQLRSILVPCFEFSTIKLI